MPNEMSAINKKIVRKKIYVMIFPIIIENILQLLAGLVSMSMLGRISVVAVSAQGICTLLIGILWSFFKGITIGATVMIAVAHGSKNKEKIRKVGVQTLVSLIFIALILVVAVRIFNKELLSIFNPEQHIFQEAQQYLKIVSLGFPFVCVMLCVTGFLQGVGNSKTPMFVALFMNVVNIVVSSTLIFGLLGNEPLGLRGAAYGLLSAQISGAMLGLFVLFNKKGLLNNSIKKKHIVPEWSVLREIYSIGIPSGLETIFWQTASIVLSRVILSFGSVAFAANQLGLQAESISEMPALGFGVAATAFTGQALGARNSQLGRQYIKEISKGALLVISFGTVLLIFFPKLVMRLLTNNQEVIDLGSIYLRLMGFIQVPQNLQRVFSGALKGAGYTKIPMIIAGIGLWGIRIPFALIGTTYFGISIVGIWAIICVDQTVRFILSIIFYKKKDIWVKGSDSITVNNETPLTIQN